MAAELRLPQRLAVLEMAIGKRSMVEMAFGLLLIQQIRILPMGNHKAVM